MSELPEKEEDFLKNINRFVESIATTYTERMKSVLNESFSKFTVETSILFVTKLFKHKDFLNYGNVYSVGGILEIIIDEFGYNSDVVNSILKLTINPSEEGLIHSRTPYKQRELIMSSRRYNKSSYHTSLFNMLIKNHFNDLNDFLFNDLLNYIIENKLSTISLISGIFIQIVDNIQDKKEINVLINDILSRNGYYEVDRDVIKTFESFSTKLLNNSSGIVVEDIDFVRNNFKELLSLKFTISVVLSGKSLSSELQLMLDEKVKEYLDTENGAWNYSFIRKSLNFSNQKILLDAINYYDLSKYNNYTPEQIKQIHERLEYGNTSSISYFNIKNFELFDYLVSITKIKFGKKFFVTMLKNSDINFKLVDHLESNYKVNLSSNKNTLILLSIDSDNRPFTEELIKKRSISTKVLSDSTSEESMLILDYLEISRETLEKDSTLFSINNYPLFKKILNI